MEKIDEAIDFIIKNGDKRWYLNSLMESVNQALYEFAAFITLDGEEELSKSHSNYARDCLRVQDLKPSLKFKSMCEKFLETKNKKMCDLVIEIVNKRPLYDQLEHNLGEKMSYQKVSVDKLGHACALHNSAGLKSIEERSRNEKKLEVALSNAKEQEKLYLKEVLDGETYLN